MFNPRIGEKICNRNGVNPRGKSRSSNAFPRLRKTNPVKTGLKCHE